MIILLVQKGERHLPFFVKKIQAKLEKKANLFYIQKLSRLRVQHKNMIREPE